LCRLLKDQGVSWRPENGETKEKHQTAVFEFPIKAPEGAETTDRVSAIDQLEYWKMLKTCWCDHNPSVTIYVGEGEWVSVGAWVYDNWDFVGGITFLPRDNQVYQLAPYETISESEYERLAAGMPDIDYEALVNYENEDRTEGSREFACSGNTCEMI
jgi:ribonucleoside-diphosphate reductase alpha chain